jgi:hypothetical protein
VGCNCGLCLGGGVDGKGIANNLPPPPLITDEDKVSAVLNNESLLPEDVCESGRTDPRFLAPGASGR